MRTITAWGCVDRRLEWVVRWALRWFDWSLVASQPSIRPSPKRCRITKSITIAYETILNSNRAFVCYLILSQCFVNYHNSVSFSYYLIIKRILFDFRPFLQLATAALRKRDAAAAVWELSHIALHIVNEWYHTCSTMSSANFGSLFCIFISFWLIGWLKINYSIDNYIIHEERVTQDYETNPRFTSNVGFSIIKCSLSLICPMRRKCRAAPMSDTVTMAG